VLQRAGPQTLALLHLGQSCLFDLDRRHVGHDHSAGQSLGAVPRASGRCGRPSACVMVGV
jgi:hypothetical protein